MIREFTGKRAAMLLAAAAAFGLSFAAPTYAGGFSDISIDLGSVDLDLGDDEDFLEGLIAMDADDIKDLRMEMAEAREDIRDAISDVREARREAMQAPNSAGFVNAAFIAAGAAVEASTGGVFNQVYAALDRAEATLNDGKADVGAAEAKETRYAIKVMREELAGVEAALDDLLTAMKQA